MVQLARATRTIGVCCALALCAVPAAAQTAAESQRAQQLFVEASELVASGKFDVACGKFEESQRLDPALGTQFNLAVCQEKIGRLGSAWHNFRGAEQLARQTGKTGRQEAAHNKLAELRGRVSALVFSGWDQSVTLKVDGERVAPDEISFYPVDAGEHRVEATASSKVPWTTRVTVPATARVELAIAIPPLASARGETRVLTVTKETTNTKRTVGYVFLAVGAAGVAAAATTGILLLNAKSTADERCAPVCDGDGNEAVARGKALLPINGITWGVAGVGLGVGAYLMLTSSASAPSTGSARISPMVGGGVQGATISGGF